jgi:iron complex outermembrane receptor protein
MSHRVDRQQTVFCDRIVGLCIVFCPVTGAVTYVNQVVNGQYVNYNQRAVPVDKETSWNYETGYRYASNRVTASTALFFNSYKNRIASAFNSDTQTTTDFNVGDSTQYGVEGEVGVNVYGPITTYTSVSYLRSKIGDSNNLESGNNTYAPTAGKQFPDTPNILAALSLQYKDKFGYFGLLQGKYTGRRQTTLVNDQNIPGYVTVNLAGGYTYPGEIAFIKQPFIRFNAVNITNSDFLNLNGPSGSNFTTNALPYRSNGVTVAGSQPSYYVGAPDFFSVTIGSDF